MFEHLTLKALDYYRSIDSTVTILLMTVILTLAITAAILIFL